MSPRDRQASREAAALAGLRVQPARLDPDGERGPWSLVIVAFLLVTIAILKPWAGGGPAAGPGGADSGPLADRGPITAGPSPSPEPTLSPDELAILRCNAPLGWRTYAWETWRGETIRHFIALEPLAAASIDGGLDPRIPVVPLIGEAITAIGYCAPVDDPSPPPPGTTVAIWRVDQSGALSTPPALRIEPTQPSGQMALYAYRDAQAANRRPAWPQGHYLFSIAGPSGSDWQRWFAVEVVDFQALSAP
ncbi:MAG: hypothetical protein ACRDF7_08115 [Candidatus Limnocylindrales bacterium]